MSKFFDSHIHFNYPELKSWFDENKHLYLDWIFNVVSTNLTNLDVALEQSENQNIFVTAGVHPLEVDGLDLEETIRDLDARISSSKKVIAVGETGLDFYRVTREEAYENQRRWLLAHYELAKKYDLPLVLHLRSAHSEALDILRKDINWRGVVHCYDGDLETAQAYLSLPGKWMISISPIVFRESSRVKEIVKHIDISRLLVETDAPFLTSNQNKIKEILEFISQEKGISFEECKSILWDNFRTFFKL